METSLLSFICLAALIGVGSGLTVGPVRLWGDETYITYDLGPSPNTSLIECPYDLADGEQVKRVYWQMWNNTVQVGAFEWVSSTGGQSDTGKLEGVVELTRDDGGLELTKLRYDLGGDYLCGVELTNGQTKNSDKEEVLIVDTSGNSWSSDNYRECNIISSFRSPAVFPEPTLHAGMFSLASNEYYEQVTDWTKMYHSNGSVTYSYNDVMFEINENTPENVTMKVELGVTKSDGSFIPLLTTYSFQNSWNELGCPAVKEEDNKDVSYFPLSSANCRGEYKDKTKATVTCKSGYRPDGAANVVVLRCNGTSFTWQPENGYTDTLEDLKCVVDEGGKDNGGNKGVVSSGNPSLALLSASLFGIVLLFRFSRP